MRVNVDKVGQMRIKQQEGIKQRYKKEKKKKNTKK